MILVSGFLLSPFQFATLYYSKKYFKSQYRNEENRRFEYFIFRFETKKGAFGPRYGILAEISLDFYHCMTAKHVSEELKKASDKGKSIILARFFKTGPGEYGEGDRFLGVTVPKQRIIAKKYQNLPLREVEKLLISPWHEHRLTGLLILTYRFSVSEMAQKKEIFDFYLAHMTQINNWDLVDATAPGIVGAYLVESGSDIGLLRHLARSSSLWERRIAIVSTFAWIRKGRQQECFEIAEILLHDHQDLIQKATGWMLREVGKRCDEKVLRDFLDRHASGMPRTMLRYAIERFPESVRQKYLRKKE